MDVMGKILSAVALLASALSASASSIGPDVPPPPPTDVDASESDWAAREADLFDAIRSDPSPRMRVLAVDAYLDDAHQTLRPEPEEVVALAAQSAPDDAFVQWTAARGGGYLPNSCRPARLPTQEVANLVRLEPDNAAAWGFAAALAAALDNEDALDSALSRMASSTRADDHFIEHARAWADLETTHPGVLGEISANAGRSGAMALSRARGGMGTAAHGLVLACTGDGGQRTWLRLGWCADAARVLAGKGASVELRKDGLGLLEALGDSGEDVATLRREYAWWSEKRSLLFLARDGATGREWAAAGTQIEAIERVLTSAGEPTTAPENWESEASVERREADEAQTQYATYLGSLAAGLRSDGGPRSLALAYRIDLMVAPMLRDDAVVAPLAARGTTTPSELQTLAASHSDDVFVQWIATTAGNGTNTTALANLQRLEPDNAAVWGLALSGAANDEDATTGLLARMADASRVDFHHVELMSAVIDAIRKTPPPRELLDHMPGSAIEEPAPELMAAGLSYSAFGDVPVALTHACGARDGGIERTAACTSIAHRLLHSDESLLMTMIAADLLRKADSMGAEDRERMRRLAWLQNVIMREGSIDMKAYIDDLFASGKEIEALRLAAARLGKSEPPSDWEPPSP